LSIKIDAEKGSGPEIAKHFNIRGYPTIVIANSKGYEVDRIVGYLSPDSFLKELLRIKKGKNTISSLLTKFQSNPNNFNTIFNLAKKYEEKGDFASANRMIEAILAANIDSSGIASFFSILYEAREKEDPESLLRYIENNPESENIKRALTEAMFYIRKKGDNKKLESELFLKLINLDNKPSLNMINSFSWRMSELELNLEIALEKINYAIENVEDIEQKHMFIDTKAELFYKMKRFESALKEIKKCIKYDPDNLHYNKQLKKINKHF
jgi:tetratricopeptide (TPR) repeat protein